MSAFLTFASILASGTASALPAFARRENVSCNMCHTNGSPAHLTEFGYIYRRQAFHWPGRLGDEKRDLETMNATNHLAIGVNVGYAYASGNGGDGNANTTMNGVAVNEVELWPLVGGFFGNWGAWSEIDAVPATNTDAGGVSLAMADIRFANGTPDFFYNFRAGLLAPEGYGASDQWFADGNIPGMDTISANRNQDTLVMPFGAMGAPEFGAELGLNSGKSHFTLGLYNGFSDITTTNGVMQSASSLSTASGKEGDVGMRDYRLQLDQFLGDYGALTVGYYSGAVALMDPTNSFNWLDHYKQARLYLTGYAVPGKLDILAGLGWAQNEYVSTSPTPDGTFSTTAGFLGLMYYATPHLNLAARVERSYFNSDDNSTTGYSLQASLPFDNRILIFHVNHYASALTTANYNSGFQDDIGVVLRFLL